MELLCRQMERDRVIVRSIGPIGNMECDKVVVWVLRFGEDCSAESGEGLVWRQQSISHNQRRAVDPTILGVKSSHVEV